MRIPRDAEVLFVVFLASQGIACYSASITCCEQPASCCEQPAVYQVACIVQNPGPAHVKARNHILRNWIPVDLQCLAGFHLNAD